MFYLMTHSTHFIYGYIKKATPKTKIIYSCPRKPFIDIVRVGALRSLSYKISITCTYIYINVNISINKRST